MFKPSFFLSSSNARVKSRIVHALLNDVAMGRALQVQKRMQENPQAALFTATLTDASGRTFYDITPLQYAIWAGDWNMWRLISQCMPPEAVQNQLESYEQHPPSHGPFFSFSELICTLEVYLENFDSWSCKQLGIQWCQAVGGAQVNAAVHVIQQMCHPTRAFAPCPQFDEPDLPRNLTLVDGGTVFPLQRCPAGLLGKDFAIFRWNKKAAGIGTMAPCPDARITAIKDLEAFIKLRDVTAARRAAFRAQFLTTPNALAAPLLETSVEMAHYTPPSP